MMGLGGQSKYTNDSHFTKFNEIIYKLKKKKKHFSFGHHHGPANTQKSESFAGSTPSSYCEVLQA